MRDRRQWEEHIVNSTAIQEQETVPVCEVRETRTVLCWVYDGQGSSDRIVQPEIDKDRNRVEGNR